MYYIKKKKSLYSDIVMVTDNIPFDLPILDEIPIIGEDITDRQQPQLEETENHLDQYRVGADETTLVVNTPCQINYENITIAPGEKSSINFNGQTM